MGRHLTVEQRQLALRLRARGWSLREIGPQVGCSHELVRAIARQAPRRPVHRDGWVPEPGRLTLADREEISIGLHAGQSFTAIAADWAGRSARCRGRWPPTAAALGRVSKVGCVTRSDLELPACRSAVTREVSGR